MPLHTPKSSWTMSPQMRTGLRRLRLPADDLLLLVPELGPPLDLGQRLLAVGTRDVAPLLDSRHHRLLRLRLPGLLPLPGVLHGLLLLHGLQLEAPDLEEGQQIYPSPDRSNQTKSRIMRIPLLESCPPP